MKVRKRAGALIISEKNRLFLFKFKFTFLAGGKTLWVAPGGGVEEGESFEQGLRRELYEEMGIDVFQVGTYSFYRKMPLKYKSGEEFLSDERFYVIDVPDEDVVFDNMTSAERQLTLEGRWWSAADIRRSDEDFFIDNLDSILEDIIACNLPPSPREI